MKTMVMVMPFGEVLLEKKQTIGYSESLKWHLYWIDNSGDKIVSIMGYLSKTALSRKAKKHDWLFS